MKKLLLFLLPLVSFSQTFELCDSILVTYGEYSSSANTITINVNAEYSNEYWFPYAGFVLTNSDGDTIARETLASANNVYGLGNGISESRNLEIVGDFDPPNTGTIHLINYFFAGNSATMCSWPFDYTTGFTYIPDNVFEQELINLGYDNELNDYVLTENISNVNYLDLGSLPIYDLTGIEHFYQLETLICSGMLLSELDVSNNSLLTILECDFNNLSELDLSNNTSLTNLNCGQNNLSELNISNNLNLSHLNCSENNLTELDLSNNLQLELLWCDFNNLSELDVSSNSNLSYLFCHDNNLSELDLLNNVNLSYLYAQNNAFNCVQIWDLNYAQENENFVIDETSYYSLDCNYDGQTPFQSIVIEEIDNENFVEGQTYRVYAKISEGKLSGYWANDNNNSYIKTSTAFYVDQANLWGNLPGEVVNKKIQRGINTELFNAIPSSRYTSWLTLGDSYETGSSECPYNAVFHKSDNFELGANSEESTYLLNYTGTIGESGFVKLAETNYTFINNNYLYYSTPQNTGWFPYGGNPNGLIQGDYCESNITQADNNELVLLFQMTTTGSICGLINLSGIDEDGETWSESGISFLIENGNITDCDGNCINDLDEDLICDEIDECVGEYDECNVCNGSGPELYYDCNWNCLNDADGDGWCDELEIVGCNDVNSCNYNPLSTDILCIYPEEYYDCNNNCINDLDGDLICDEIDACIGEYDECNTCNGVGPEQGYDCNGNCIDGYTQLTLVWSGGLNTTFIVTGEIAGLLYTETFDYDTGYLTECWLTDLQSDCFTISIEGGENLVWELFADNTLILEGNSESMFFGAQCTTGCADQAACGNYDPFALIDDGSCQYPGDECEFFDVTINDFIVGLYNDECDCVSNNISLKDNVSRDRSLITIVDVLGQIVPSATPGQTLLYIFDDGSIEKTHIIK